jgi:hypothetical protein
MDERTLMPYAALDDLRAVVRDLLVELGRFVVAELAPRSRHPADPLPVLPTGIDREPLARRG